MRLLERLAEHATDRADALAVRSHGPCAEAPLSYGRLWEQVRALAAVLAANLPPESVVMLACANRPEFFIAYLGVLHAGLTVFPVYTRLTAAELRDACSATRAVAIIAENDTLKAAANFGLVTIPVRALNELAPASHRSPGTPSSGLLLQSSGTTGLPKIAYRDSASLDAVADNVARAASLSPEDRVLGIVPLGHSYGMENILLGPIWAGACAHLCDGFDVPVVTALVRNGATVLPGGAFMFDVLSHLESPGPAPRSFRLAYSAGSPLPASIACGFSARFGVAVGQLYGATEVGSVTFNDPGPRDQPTEGFDPSAVGRPMSRVRIAIRPLGAASVGAASDGEGEVLVQAPSMLSRYAGDTADPFVAYAGSRWFPTGDLGRGDDSGRLWITGRLKLLIDVGGVKVNPLEIESVLERHESVGRCVVLPIPVSETVSRVKAIITPRFAGSTVDLDAIRQFARDRLAGYKIPRVFEVRESLPLTPTGKVARSQLATETGIA